MIYDKEHIEFFGYFEELSKLYKSLMGLYLAEEDSIVHIKGAIPGGGIMFPGTVSKTRDVLNWLLDNFRDQVMPNIEGGD
jgi:hypothetical protein